MICHLSNTFFHSNVDFYSAQMDQMEGYFEYMISSDTKKDKNKLFENNWMNSPTGRNHLFYAKKPFLKIIFILQDSGAQPLLDESQRFLIV